MRIGVHLVNFDFLDGPESAALTLAKVGSAAEAAGSRRAAATGRGRTRFGCHSGQQGEIGGGQLDRFVAPGPD